MATRPTDSPAGNSGSTRSLRLLVVANEAVGGDRLVEEISKRAGDLDSAEVMIVSPARGASPLALAAGDVDDEIAQAHKRLESSVGALREKGIIARGEVGEAQPDLAMRDALVKFPADEVIIVAPPQEDATWLETDLLERVRREVTVPITYVEVEPHQQAPAVRDVKQVAPKGRQRAAERGREEADTDYLPPMPARDRAALLLGPLGTIALWLLTSSCQGQLAQDFGGTDAGCVALGILAIFALIITAIHVPALLLLRSGRYTSEGLAGFMSKTILFYIPAALLAGLIIAIAA
jgi:hypothetical protein